MTIKPNLLDEYAAYVDNNQDGYGMGVITFAERWANEMAERLGQGLSMPDIAKGCCEIADTEGITGFMYGCAVKSLAYFWEHGEALRVWHNKDCQIGTEGEDANKNGGVLNPAVMVIG